MRVRRVQGQGTACARSSVWRGLSWSRAVAFGVGFAGLLALPGTGAASAQPQLATWWVTTTRVIVTSGTVGDANQQVGEAGGHVDAELGIINGVVADVTPAELGALGADPLLTVSPDSAVFPADTAVAFSRAPAAVFPAATGASRLVAAGTTGSRVNVAVLDTGIAPLADFAGRLVGGVDLSGEGSPFKDSHGHGTFVAGLIAGNGASSGGAYTGEAPGAGLVSIKVAGASGVTDMATVIAGIGWAVANQHGLRIGVLNLSLGALPTQSTVRNPLDRAVEAAWKAGLVVVASAGNTGPSNGTILSPGDDPLVVTVGALDDRGTAVASDDIMTSFSSVGPTSPDGWFKPDLVTSGRSVISLRAPGSTIDTNYPSARIGAANFVGSGTSFSAAITSGAAALILQANPGASPDRVKARLLATTNPGPVGNPFVDGHGALNAYGAATTSQVQLRQSTTAPTPVGATANLQSTWNGSSWNSSAWKGSAWNGSSWNGSAWNGAAWNSSAWNGAAWNSSAWNGAAWNSSAWNGAAWNSSAWNGSAWNGSAWNGSVWNGSAWNGSSWNGASWN